MEEEKKVKVMNTLYGDTVRSIVRQVNERKIQKEDVVTLIKEAGMFILIYYI